MSNKIHTVNIGQTLFDIANMYAGTIEAIVEIALFNNISPTVDLIPGQQLTIPLSFENYNAEVVDYFNRKNIQLASNGTYTN